MILLKQYFNRTTLNLEGSLLSKIVAEKLLKNDGPVSINFESISRVSTIFFQDFLFPLILEFGHDAVYKRISLINLSDSINLSYQETMSKSSEYVGRIIDKHKHMNKFGDISSITFELLIKAREVSRRDPSAAHIIFGMDSTMIESIAVMDIEQIRRISCSGVICFEPRFTTEFASRLAALNADEVDMFLNVAGGIEMDGIYDSKYH